LTEGEESTSTEKPKAKRQRKPKATTVRKEGETFPMKGSVNAYGFIHLSNGVAEAFGAQRGEKMPITIDLKDGKLIIAKA